MKQEHKVNLELVNKLIDNNFPFSWNPEDVTVMELLDKMPSWIIVNYKNWDIGNYKLEIGRQWTSESTDAYYVHYVEWTGAYSFMLWTLPNALAEMWLWLKENGYLSIK